MMGMKVGICSFSFHRTIASGEMDVLGYIDTCKKLGCMQIDPWSAHLTPPDDAAPVLKAGKNPNQSHELLAGVDNAFLDRIAAHAKNVGLPFGTFAVDGAHIYEQSPESSNPIAPAPSNGSTPPVDWAQARFASMPADPPC